MLWKFMLRLRGADAFSVHPLQWAAVPTVAPCCAFSPELGTDTPALLWTKGCYFGMHALSTKPSLNYQMVFLYCVCMHAGFLHACHPFVLSSVTKVTCSTAPHCSCAQAELCCSAWTGCIVIQKYCQF